MLNLVYSPHFSHGSTREADRYGAEKVITVKVLVEVEIALAGDETEVEGETVEVDEAGNGSV